MRIFRKEPNFKLMNKRYYAFCLSGLIVLAGVVSFFLIGFNLGIDFTGGTLIEVSFIESRTEDEVRAALLKAGFIKSSIQRADKQGHKFFIKTVGSFKKSDKEKSKEDIDEVSKLEKISILIDQALISEQERDLRAKKIDLNNSSEKKITDFLTSKGISKEDATESAKKIIDLTKMSEVGLIRDFKEIDELDLKKRVISEFKENTFLGSFTFPYIEIVGSQVGHDLRQKTTLAAVWVMLGMLIYIGFRFRFIYGFAAVITLFHDLLICLSFLLFFRIEFSLKVFAALLLIIGYSLNDTIVIFDRVRDNIKLMRRDNATNILDRSINQTLSRTIITSGTTLMTLLALFFLGGEVIHSFSFTLIIGIIVGTYSSVFQSCAWLKIWEKSFLGRKKS